MESTRKRFRVMGTKRDKSEKLVCHSLQYLHLAFRRTPQAEEISSKLSNLKSAEKQRAKKIQDAEATIRKMQADLEKPRNVENMDDIEGEMDCPFRLC